MADGRRPGGLTALAVINFVFGGLRALGTLAMFAVIGLAKDALEKGMSSSDYHGPGIGVLYLSTALSALSGTFLIISGIGYIQQKRVLGRMMGNIYAVLSIAWSIMDLAVVQDGSIGAIIGLIYPVVTLFLINNTFKDDLVN